MGRGIRKLVSLFDDATTILDEVDNHAVNIRGAEVLQPEDQRQYVISSVLPLQLMTTFRHDRLLRAYPLLLRLVPQLKTVVREQSSENVTAFLSQVSQVICAIILPHLWLGSSREVLIVAEATTSGGSKSNFKNSSIEYSNPP